MDHNHNVNRSAGVNHQLFLIFSRFSFVLNYIKILHANKKASAEEALITLNMKNLLLFGEKYLSRVTKGIGPGDPNGSIDNRRIRK
jgi:hypothetical protein